MANASVDALFAPDLVSCVAEGGDPDAASLFAVACRVWVDSAAERSAFGWGRLAPTDPDRVRALRIAQAALAGHPVAEKHR